MELLQQEETLYKISSEESRTRKQIIDFKLSRSLSVIPEHWHKRSFADFNKISGDFKKYVDKVKDWDFENPNTAGIISIQNGIGKTHLATCILKKFIRENLEKEFDRMIIACNDRDDDEIKSINDFLYPGSFSNVRFKQYDILSEKKLSLEIQDTFNQTGYHKTQKDILDSYCKADFLIMDDLFSTKQNDFARQNIFYILDERSEWKNKPTFITSNLSLSEIADIDTRIADRIRNSMLFQVKEKMESFRKLN